MRELLQLHVSPLWWLSWCCTRLWSDFVLFFSQLHSERAVSVFVSRVFLKLHVSFVKFTYGLRLPRTDLVDENEISTAIVQICRD